MDSNVFLMWIFGSIFWVNKHLKEQKVKLPSVVSPKYIIFMLWCKKKVCWFWSGRDASSCSMGMGKRGRRQKTFLFCICALLERAECGQNTFKVSSMSFWDIFIHTLLSHIWQDLRERGPINCKTKLCQFERANNRKLKAIDLFCFCWDSWEMLSSTQDKIMQWSMTNWILI